jgi:hypothetical protein
LIDAILLPSPFESAGWEKGHRVRTRRPVCDRLETFARGAADNGTQRRRGSPGQKNAPPVEIIR